MIFLSIAIITTCLAQLCYKLYFLREKRGFLVLSVVSFVVTPLFSYLSLKELTIDQFYLATSLNIVLLLLLSRVTLKEHVGRQKIIAAIIIVLGIVVFNS